MGSRKLLDAALRAILKILSRTLERIDTGERGVWAFGQVPALTSIGIFSPAMSRGHLSVLIQYCIQFGQGFDCPFKIVASYGSRDPLQRFCQAGP